MSRKNIRSGIVILVVIFGLLMLVGNLQPHTNPPVTYSITWDSPQSEVLARRACFDCHSNETVWPWYAFVAPASFLVIHDVEEGRGEVNFSTGFRLNAREMVSQIQRGNMPPKIYLPLHPAASLSDAEKQQLIAGLQATFKR